MCQGRTHKFRVTIKPGNQTPVDHTFMAKGLADAIAQADGWASVHYPEEWCEFTSHRTPYGPDVAVEHGAKMPYGWKDHKLSPTGASVSDLIY
jgi:hypothetical protein